MKEVIVERVVKVTEIIKVNDNVIGTCINEAKDITYKREWAKDAKQRLCADDVQVKDVKVFVRDIPETKKKVSKRKSEQTSETKTTEKKTTKSRSKKKEVIE